MPSSKSILETMPLTATMTSVLHFATPHQSFHVVIVSHAYISPINEAEVFQVLRKLLPGERKYVRWLFGDRQFGKTF